MKKITTFFAFAVLFTANATYAQEKTEISQVKPINVEKQMKGFDEYANKLIKDWNCPGKMCIRDRRKTVRQQKAS